MVAISTSTMFWPPLPRPPPPSMAPHMAMRPISPASMPTPDAMVMIATSRCATWLSSWASTASSSSSLRRRMSPRVAQMTA